MDQIFYTVAGFLGIAGLIVWTPRVPSTENSAIQDMILYFVHLLAVLLAAISTLVWPYSHWPIWGGWAFTLGLILLLTHTVSRRTSVHDRPWIQRIGYSALLLGWIAFILTPWFK